MSKLDPSSPNIVEYMQICIAANKDSLRVAAENLEERASVLYTQETLTAVIEHREQRIAQLEAEKAALLAACEKALLTILQSSDVPYRDEMVTDLNGAIALAKEPKP
jgi:hypothetical protein